MRVVYYFTLTPFFASVPWFSQHFSACTKAQSGHGILATEKKIVPCHFSNAGNQTSLSWHWKLNTRTFWTQKLFSICLIHLFQYMPQSQDFKTFLFSFLKIKNNIYFFLLCLSFLLSQTQSNSVSLVHQVSQAKQEASHWQGRYHSLASHFPIVSADCWVCFFLSPLD